MQWLTESKQNVGTDDMNGKKLMAGLLTVTLAAGAGAGFARSDMKVESTREIPSPAGDRSVVVDRLSPVENGAPERFSGRMIIRVKSAGKPPRQRYVEASQVRVIQPPVWLDGDRLCAYVYNIAKNSNGTVYYEPDSNAAYQVEFVQTSRRMGATGQVEQELTSFDVVELTSKTTTIHNVPHGGASVFPLVLAKIPAFDGAPYGLDFYGRLKASVQAYEDFLAKRDLEPFEPEQASESFSSDNKWASLLACSGKNAYVCVVPLDAPGAAEALKKAIVLPLPGVDLGCSGRAETEHSESESNAHYSTAWTGAKTVQVLRETFGSEDESSQKSAVFTINVDNGKITPASPSAAIKTTSETTAFVEANPAR
jgi:hypothetical protein